MLKIKDNVDLKELEKYGFKQGQDTTDISYSAYGKKFDIDGSLMDIVNIDKKTKKIKLERTAKNAFRSFIYEDEDKLKTLINDLIKADLVDKVEEE